MRVRETDFSSRAFRDRPVVVIIRINTDQWQPEMIRNGVNPLSRSKNIYYKSQIIHNSEQLGVVDRRQAVDQLRAVIYDSH